MGAQHTGPFIPLEVTFVCQETGPAILLRCSEAKEQGLSLRIHRREGELCLS